MTIILFILVFFSLLVSIINIIYLIKLVNKKQEESVLNTYRYDESTNEILARFQKITSSRLRALDNKIEIVDQLIKDIDDSYSKAFSILTELERELDKQHKIKKDKDIPIETTPNNKNIEKDTNNKKEKQSSNEKIRIYEIAKELNVNTNEVIQSINDNTDLQVYNSLQNVPLKIKNTIIKNNKLIKNPEILTEKKYEKDIRNNKTVEETKKETSHKPVKSFDNNELDKKYKIIEYKNKGLSKEEIAKELKIGVGEVMLYINLYSNKET